MSWVEVAVAAPLPHSLAYVLDDELASPAAELVGRRVLVPLGRRRVTGYILAVLVEPPAGEFALRPVLQLLDATPLFRPSQVPLFRWLAQYYHFPLGEAIKVALPAGLTLHSVRWLETVQADIHTQEITEQDNALLQRLHQQGRLSVSQSAALFADKAAQRTVNRLLSAGALRWREGESGQQVREKKEICYRCQWPLIMPKGTDATPSAADLRRVQEHLEKNCPARFSKKALKTFFFLQMFSALSPDGSVTRRDLLARYSGAADGLGELQKSDCISQEERRVYRNLFGQSCSQLEPPPVLSAEQEQVLAKICQALPERAFRTFLLHGVTGSGKTEVYLRAAEKTLALGRDVLVLVPEIALATQLEEHFICRFAGQVVLLHSGLSSGERFDQWSLALNGQGRVVIGARSAVFAPLADCGLIVVDEEHDGGFKQDDSLRYHGRDVAVMRGKMDQAVVVLASATPSITSYSNALAGKYQLLQMENRIGESSLPHVHVIDLSNKGSIKRENLFRPALAAALQSNLQQQKQSVILLNRRGFSTTVLCQECGAPVECANCQVSLTLHKSRQALLCHYCGHSVHQQTVCNRCGSMALTPVGFGTERVEEELRLLLPEARIARIDTDTASDRKLFLRVLRDMRAGQIDVLVGTQMVAKGHHFPDVTLVGVVWADGGLGLPDFRAAEKTYQLITQVIGRAGRGDQPGEVYIQTYRPEHYAIRYACLHRYDLLVDKEMELRRKPLFPPYVRLVLIHVQGEREEAVRQSAQMAARLSRQWISEQRVPVELLGPMPSPLERLRRKYRWQLLLKSSDMNSLHQLCSDLDTARAEITGNRCTLALDVDPENML